jgi:predicted esterase YcpF (UPF0227 family)
MILNLHGYRGSSENTMYQILHDLFPERKIISPPLDYDAKTPFEIRALIAEQMNSEIDLIVGTSMGGFFALDLWAKNKTVPTILFNSVLKPWKLLPLLGYKVAPELYDEAKEIYRDFIANAGDKDKLYAIYGKHDEVLNIKQADGTIESHGSEVFLSTEELCLIRDGQPLNVWEIECAHSAGDNPKAIAKIKEIVLTLHKK